jgi:7,8-dihydropterin-6-yl-methyl-4-(beta-D-ribofuranosyl)aminobenzene 5'-phosphate synthase
MAEKALELSSRPLYMVMGGFHLMQASGPELEEVLNAFRRMGVQRAGPTHCSGLMAMRVFQNAYGDDFQRLGVGRVLKFPLGTS